MKIEAREITKGMIFKVGVKNVTATDNALKVKRNEILIKYRYLDGFGGIKEKKFGVKVKIEVFN